ncbi:MAG TPA: carboxymuconolactone decarboxylase family protein [Acidocella sp.]|jgi:4-carboxymuconolactone decarboxylase|nr:carboxymuconolactone decarboxylase family protein [Acidocella sp.]
MNLLDPAVRTQAGIARRADLTGLAPPEPATLLDASWRDYIYAEVWTRPGLDLRSRFLISMASAAGARDHDATERYARGALHKQELTLAELREAALHVAVYAGWTSGQVLDDAITRAATVLGLEAAKIPPIRAEPWDPAVRHKEGQANFATVMCFGGPPPKTAYFEGGIVNFVFGEMWMRPGLDQRSRRWLTLVGVCDSSSSTPIRSHIWAAMASGNATAGEMYEFVLQYAIHAGWPKGSVAQGAVMEQADRVAKGLPFEA